MRLFSSFGVSRRLYALSIVLSLPLAGVGGFAFVSMQNISNIATKTEMQRVPQMLRISKVEAATASTALQIRNAILARTPQERDAALAKVGAGKDEVTAALDTYAKAIFTEAGRQHFAKITPAYNALVEVTGANLQMVLKDQKAEAFAHLADKVDPAYDSFIAALRDNSRYQEETSGRELASLRSQSALTLDVLLGLVGVTIVGLMLLSWHIAAVLRQRVAASRAVAERVRDGDLTQSVRDGSRDEFSPLLTALADMQASLTHVVSGVRGNAESVATASAQIAQGNLDLSGRTEQQASTLQQTAATMDELGATVRNNADSAQQANQLAASASEVATKGGTVVNQVVETMRGINDSSKRIADIITVIDGIAFQTNILALNAAVEAARAGEQGRGFAVVAGEVRTLAQRSAEAAREIKELITTSVERVERGSELVSEAGQTMDEILSSIARVRDIVGEISSASVEQSAGVSQVGQAVTQMDQATQHNAALVEESAAAAASLKEQADQLVQSVSVFRLAHAH